MRGYKLWAYFEESASLFEITMNTNRHATAEEVAAADDWRLRRMEIKPVGKGGLTGDFFGSPAEAAKQAILTTATNFDSPACRNLEFRLVEIGTEGVNLEPEFSFKLFDE